MNASDTFDVAIVGGGIVGLAHAWRASQRGLKVALFERDLQAQGASVRNFGMIWPVGQPAGEPYQTALLSAKLWQELHNGSVVEVEPCGSLHLAHHEDELAVLDEFCKLGSHHVEMLTADQVKQRTALANPEGLLGGMWSATELRVDPRTASAKIANWLGAEPSVSCFFDTAIAYVDSGRLEATDGRVWNAKQIVICSGSDLQTLFPEVMGSLDLRLCKLQMLRAASQPDYQGLAPHIASGLTLRHYKSFEACPSLASLKQRIADDSPELDQYGIHVMASQFPNGEVVLGDSHEYGNEISPFDKSEIDELMLRELRNVIQLSDWTIIERWHGIYAKHPSEIVVDQEIKEGIRAFVGPGGAGMTLSFGLAENAWAEWTGN